MVGLTIGVVGIAQLPLVVDPNELVRQPLVRAIGVFVGFLVLGYATGRVNKRLLQSAGVPDLVEGTTFERTAQGLGSSTVSVMARLSSWFIYGVGALVALHMLGLLDAHLFWQRVTIFVPRLFVAIVVVIVGVVVGEKAELLVSERLRGVKVPEVNVFASVAKYSVIFVAVLIALSQVGVATGALLILLGVYFFGLVFLTGLAFYDLLSSAAAGLYLLLNQPYEIGDDIRIGEHRGIVQEVDLLTTLVENDTEEYIIPNRDVFSKGVVRVRD